MWQMYCCACVQVGARAQPSPGELLVSLSLHKHCQAVILLYLRLYLYFYLYLYFHMWEELLVSLSLHKHCQARLERHQSTFINREGSQKLLLFGIECQTSRSGTRLYSYHIRVCICICICICTCICICICICEVSGEEMLLVWGGARTWGIEGTLVMEEQPTLAFHISMYWLHCTASALHYIAVH